MLVYDDLKQIDNDIYYLPSEEEPVLSADIGLFFGGNFVWSYDCGASKKACELMNRIDNKNIVISHFHKDHTYNINDITNVNQVYLSKYSFNHFKTGNVVDKDIWIEDKGLIHIFPLPNSHCKGSMAMEINEKYVFIGDSSYGKHIDKHLTYNVQLLTEQIKILSKIKADTCLVSHDPRYVVDKEEILAKFEKILSKSISGNPLIVL